MIRKNLVSNILLGLVIFSLCRLVQGYLDLKIPVLGIFYFNNFIGFSPYANYGLAFGWLISNYFLIFLNLTIIIFLIIYWFSGFSRPKDSWQNFFLTLIIAGAVSNFYERLTTGFIKDFFVIWHLPVFNLADLFIFLGVVFLISRTWTKAPKS
jgi:signal peptidase II